MTAPEQPRIHWDDPVGPIRPTSRRVETTRSDLPDPASGNNPGGEVAVSDPADLVAGRPLSLRFMRSALRRRRRYWVAAAVAGLAIGVMYHVVVPLKHQATATVYLAHPPNSDQTVAAANDLAMLDTTAVGDRAIALLGVHGVSSSALLGKLPGTLESDNILTITIDGNSPSQALSRVNAVARAYLAFRAQQYDAQSQAIVVAESTQLAKLQAQSNTLSAEIAASAAKTPTTIATLQSEKATTTAQISSLQASIQQNQIASLTVARGSRILSPGVTATSSREKVLLLDGLTGLLAGLGAAALLVIVLAALSDRLRTREDVARALGVPVGVSVARVRGRGLHRHPTVLEMASPDNSYQSGHEIGVLAHFFRRYVRGTPAALVVAACDDVQVPGAAIISLASSLAASKTRVVLVDATDQRVLAEALGCSMEASATPVECPGRPSMSLLVLPRPWEAVDDGTTLHSAISSVRDAEVVLVLATVDPSRGAAHIRTWGREAIVTVTTGKSTAYRLAGVTELLRAAGITVTTAALLGADATDDSIGLPLAGDEELVYGAEQGNRRELDGGAARPEAANGARPDPVPRPT